MGELQNEEPGIIYHYTDKPGARGIIESQSLWATHYEYLNDISELMIFKAALARWRSSIDNAPKKADCLLKKLLGSLLGSTAKPPITEAYIASFCNDGGDRLSQWRAYGKGGGLALGFDRTELHGLLEKEHKSTRLDSVSIETVYYGNREKMPESLDLALRKCLELLNARIEDRTNDFKEAVLLFIKCLSSFKHDGFSEEREVRLVSFVPHPSRERNQEKDDRPEKMIKFRASQRMLVPYIELFEGRFTLPIREIWVGPSPDAELGKHAVQILLARKRMNPDIVTISRIPYRGR